MNIEALLGYEIIDFGVRNDPDGSDNGNSYSDVCDSDFYVFVTKEGECKINLRCEHNGYYSGCLTDPINVKGWSPNTKQKQVTVDYPFRG